jgi:D,D-heptose 1,7-bisphosphate phosphatase
MTRAVIMAGGLGTRLRCVAQDIPKPLVPVAGVPVLERQIACLARQGVTDITLTVGYLAERITSYFGDGARLGVRIRYVREETPMGTAGALYYMKDFLTEDFLLLNGDVLFDADIGRFAEYHKSCGALATLFAHPNYHPYDSGLLRVDENSMVTGWLHKEDPRGDYRNLVNAGLHMLSPDILRCFDAPAKRDLDRDILKPLVGTGRLAAYISPEYVLDMGTPERLRRAEADVASGKVERRNLSRRQKAVFLDRDGTINVSKGFVAEPDALDLMEGTAEGIRRVNQSEYLAIVVTNQPVVARGQCTEEDLRRIHDRMERLLGEKGAYVDDIYYCPHHPDGGYPGEVRALKRVCDCRKPAPGMLLRAAEKYNIDLPKSYMVGDSDRDMGAGEAAGCKTVRISPECPSILSFAERYLG